MRMFCGLSTPTSGKAMVAGFDVYKNAEEIKNILVTMSQKFSLYENFIHFRKFGILWRNHMVLSMKEIKQKAKNSLRN